MHAALDGLVTEVTDPNAEAWVVLAASEATDRAAEATLLIDGSMAGVSRSNKSPGSTVPKESRAGLKRGGEAG